MGNDSIVQVAHGSVKRRMPAEDARHAWTAQGTSSLTPLPREAPRPHRGAPDKSSGPCARGAAEGYSPRCGARSIPSQYAERGKEQSPPGRAKPPTPEGRSRQELGTMCAGRSRGALRFLSQSAGAHMQGAPPLRCRVRREGGASRGWGFEAALRRTARSPVVTRTVSHGSEPIQRGNLRGGLVVAGKAPGALPVAAGSRCHGGHLSRWIASGTPRASRFPAPAGPIRVLAERPSGQSDILFTEPAFQQRVGTPISVKPAVLGGRRVPGSWLCSTGTFRPGTL